MLTARVYRLCLALVGDEANARDAAQESLTRAWRRRAQRRPEVSWWTWSAGFAVRVCRESRRRSRAAPSVLGDVPDIVLAADEPSGADRDRLASVHRAITHLPERQREVVVLRLLLGQSTETSARMLGCPAGTVKSNLHKALRNLRMFVERSDVADDL